LTYKVSVILYSTFYNTLDNVAVILCSMVSIFLLECGKAFQRLELYNTVVYECIQSSYKYMLNAKYTYRNIRSEAMWLVS